MTSKEQEWVDDNQREIAYDYAENLELRARSSIEGTFNLWGTAPHLSMLCQNIFLICLYFFLL